MGILDSLKHTVGIGEEQAEKPAPARPAQPEGVRKVADKKSDQPASEKPTIKQAPMPDQPEGEIVEIDGQEMHLAGISNHIMPEESAEEIDAKSQQTTPIDENESKSMGKAPENKGAA